jgi:pimeloyl-ACP methyl ester carboxylesterase
MVPVNVRSKDGTPIAYEAQGTGAPLIIVNGALTTRSSEGQAELAGLLAPSFTVYRYDRRGRGDSGDTAPYAVAREIDDIEALSNRAGAAAYLFGHSSGGCLAFAAARALGASRIAGVAAYEAPWNDDPTAQRAWAQYLIALDQALGEGRDGDAVALFMGYVGTPAEQIEGMRRAPFWAGYEALAPTLRYDHTELMGATAAVPADLLAGVTMPVLALCGDASMPFMCVTARTIARLVPRGEVVTLAGQTHGVQPAALAPELIGFFDAQSKAEQAA